MNFARFIRTFGSGVGAAMVAMAIFPLIVKYVKPLIIPCPKKDDSGSEEY
ncbi:MAG: hypothetical protein ACUZ8E_02120 [Candidatus Anammoxibacter sp.]